ncbi:hypothetical protein IMG5_179200 [Ichthyophthirius multifiliis]|uniref:non-specific serine/threonine protein kinase n=1 Tax=Ichthyophthirius multifiliis TaxID=5932 RepID=G0R2K9_ICHMU|nr:hypothetical protein IMG5_179200 [Ichthyophthirius multifiliis]EGR28300.1 hypothetical protein IMG5_179200 [Ichthyophthirius multifiliis]|eukprot:XP_004027645.1 hypothetical protein IMG5_179200 [Ichthyophthirius multifiliis]
MDIKVSKPKFYADANIRKGSNFYDYENIDINWGYINNYFIKIRQQKNINSEQNNYEIIRKLGRGKYSEVYEAINTLINKQCVIKVLKPRGNINVISLQDIVRDPASKTTSLVFEYINNIDYRTLYPTLSDMDVRYYTYQILKCLDYAHSQGIMHRDIKPHNIMIDHEKRLLRIIDWGLAEYYFPGKDYNVRVSSRYFKGPELLVDYQYYDYSLDIWSLGAMFAGIIFKKEPFFQGNDNYDQLEKITRVLGTNELFEYLSIYKLTLDKKYEGILGKNPKKQLNKFVNNENKNLSNNEAIDLLSKMLLYNHAERITAKEAMLHPYFQPILSINDN